MQLFTEIDKLDIIIFLLLLIIFAGLFKYISGRIYRSLSGTAHSQVINAFIDKGWDEGALRKCEKFLEKRPGDTFLLWTRATLYYRLGEKDKARAEFLKFVDEQPLWKEDAEKYLSTLDSEK